MSKVYLFKTITFAKFVLFSVYFDRYNWLLQMRDFNAHLSVLKS